MKAYLLIEIGRDYCEPYGIFSSKERAEVARSHWHMFGYIKEFDLDLLWDMQQAGKTSWRVYFWIDKKIDTEPVSDFEGIPREGAVYELGELMCQNFRIECWAKDKDEALEIATKLRDEYMAKAKEEWLEQVKSPDWEREADEA